MGNSDEEPAFTDIVVPDPANVSPTRLIIGYPGASGSEATARVYLTPGLSEYVEFPQTSIAYQAQVEPSGVLQRTAFWVRQDERIVKVHVESSSVEGSFMDGDISSALLRSAGAGGLAAPALISLTWTVLTTLKCAATVVIKKTVQHSCVGCNVTTAKCPTMSDTSATSCCLCF